MQAENDERAAIEALTRQTDFRGLAEQLLAAVSSIAGCHPSLYETHDENGRTAIDALDIDRLVLRRFPDRATIAHPSWFAVVMDRVAAAAGPGLIHRDASGESVFMIGELNGVWRFLTVDLELSEVEVETVAFLIRIFSNQLTVLDRFERDALTGLRNRQSFDYRFEDLLEHHQRNPNREEIDSMPWLAMVDIDRFKLINDTYGHLFGDEILLLLARLLEQHFRFDDLLFRYGGEEFIIILNNTDAAGAELALERFRKTIEDYDFPTVGKVTLSIGWAPVRPGEIATTVIHNADQALYQAKAKGRNRIVKYDDADSGVCKRATRNAVDLFD